MAKGINAGVVMAIAMSVLMFGVLGIIASVGASITSGVQATQTVNTVAYNTSSQVLTGITNISAQFPLMGTILVFGGVIALLLAVFWVRGKGSAGGMFATLYSNIVSAMPSRKGINAGVIAALAMSIMAFVIMGVIVSVTATIGQGVRQTQCTTYNASTGDCTAAGTSVASNITSNMLLGVSNVGAQMGLLGTILVFGAIIALLLAVFWVKGKGTM